MIPVHAARLDSAAPFGAVSGCSTRSVITSDPADTYNSFRNEYGNCNANGFKSESQPLLYFKRLRTPHYNVPVG